MFTFCFFFIIKTAIYVEIDDILNFLLNICFIFHSYLWVKGISKNLNLQISISIYKINTLFVTRLYNSFCSALNNKIFKY